MKIYLVRHGDSHPYGIDDERVLSEQGKEDIQRLAHFLSPLRLTPRHIVHSPKNRTQETAELLLPAFTSPPDLEINEDLTPEASVNGIIDNIQKENTDWVIVSHLPFLQKLVSRLCTGREDNDIVLIKTGTMICLEQIEYDHFRILWMVNPKIII